MMSAFSKNNYQAVVSSQTQAITNQYYRRHYNSSELHRPKEHLLMRRQLPESFNYMRASRNNEPLNQPRENEHSVVRPIYGIMANEPADEVQFVDALPCNLPPPPTLFPIRHMMENQGENHHKVHPLEGAEERFDNYDGGESEPPSCKRKKRSKYLTNDGKICAVCGDSAKSMHFGAMSCDSCKAFFRRSVQNNRFGTFVCNEEKNCPIVKDYRRICQYCRFQKCICVGMEIRWVMSEADRMSLWKSKLSKHRNKNQTSSQTRSPPPKPANVEGTRLPVVINNNCGSLHAEEREAVEHLVTLQELVFASMPYPEDCSNNDVPSLANLFFCICQKLRTFFYRLSDFHKVSENEQTAVLRNGIAMSIYLHGAHSYDVENTKWPRNGVKKALSMPFITHDTLRSFTVVPEIYSQLMKFYNTFGEDLRDEAVLVLLSLITLFMDNEQCSVSRAYIQNLNNRYIYLLRNYLSCVEGPTEGDKKLTKLLDGLFTIRNIISFHKVVDIRHSIDTSILIRKNKLSLADQIKATSDLLSKAIMGNNPSHSSVFDVEEKINKQLRYKNHRLFFDRPQFLPDPAIDKYYFHPTTNGLIEPGITNRIVSFNHKNIIGLYKMRICKKEVREPDNKIAQGNSVHVDDEQLNASSRAIEYYPRINQADSEYSAKKGVHKSLLKNRIHRSY